MIDRGEVWDTFTPGQLEPRGRKAPDRSSGDPVPSPAEGWRERAACVGVASEVFFPTGGPRTNMYDEARTYCDRCEVRDDCLLDDQEVGGYVAGFRAGLTARERERLPRRQRREEYGRVFVAEWVHTHGTRGGYSSGCRCGDCRGAASEWERARHLRRKSAS